MSPKYVRVNGPTQVFVGDNISLTCESGPSNPGRHFYSSKAATFFSVAQLGWRQGTQMQSFDHEYEDITEEIIYSSDGRAIMKSKLALEVKKLECS